MNRIQRRKWIRLEHTKKMPWQHCQASNPVYAILWSQSKRTTKERFEKKIWRRRSGQQVKPNSTWLDSTLLDSTRHVRCVEPMHFGCVDIVEQHSSTCLTRRDRLVRLARHDESDSQLSLLCNFYIVMITVIHVLFNVSYLLIYWLSISRVSQAGGLKI